MDEKNVMNERKGDNGKGKQYWQVKAINSDSLENLINHKTVITYK